MKDVCAWYREHYGGFVLSTSSTREVALIEFGALVDPYPCGVHGWGFAHGNVEKMCPC